MPAKSPASATRLASRNGSRPQDRRERRRLEHQDLSRTQLLDAAEVVFGRKGFHDTTLKEIAEHAGFSVGSVYSFFGSKDDLFVSVFLRRGDEFMPRLESLLGGEGDPLERLHAVVDLEVGFFREHPHFGRLSLRTASGFSPSAKETDLARQLAPNFARAMELQADLIRRGQRSKVFRSGDPEVLARMLTGLITGYQALDPGVVADEPNGERFPLAELHDLVEQTFLRRRALRRSSRRWASSRLMLRAAWRSIRPTRRRRCCAPWASGWRRTSRSPGSAQPSRAGRLRFARSAAAPTTRLGIRCSGRRDWWSPAGRSPTAGSTCRSPSPA